MIDYIPLSFLLAISAGASFVMQSTVNSRLRAGLNSPFWAGFVSYLGGAVLMALILASTRTPWPKPEKIRDVPWIAWSGGFFGVIYILLLILLLPRLGTGMTVALFVAGQMITSMVLDHFGLFGVPVHPLNLARFAGGVLLVFGVILIRR